jgi:hypothetical protein
MGQEPTISTLKAAIRRQADEQRQLRARLRLSLEHLRGLRRKLTAIRDHTDDADDEHVASDNSTAVVGRDVKQQSKRE